MFLHLESNQITLQGLAALAGGRPWPSLVVLDLEEEEEEVCYSLWRSYDRSTDFGVGLPAFPPPLLRDTQPLHKNPYCGDKSGLLGCGIP